MRRRQFTASIGAIVVSPVCAGVTRGESNRYVGTVDRLNGQHATVLFESDGRVVDDEVLDVTDLPPPARNEGSVVEVSMQNGSVESIEYLEEETERRLDANSARFDELSA